VNFFEQKSKKDIISVGKYKQIESIDTVI